MKNFGNGYGLLRVCVIMVELISIMACNGWSGLFELVNLPLSLLENSYVNWLIPWRGRKCGMLGKRNLFCYWNDRVYNKLYDWVWIMHIYIVLNCMEISSLLITIRAETLYGRRENYFAKLVTDWCNMLCGINLNMVFNFSMLAEYIGMV